MDKMLTAIFDSAPKALKGVIVLRDLHRAGDIKLYATAVIAKYPSGNVSIKQASERKLKGAPLGLLIGGLLGVWAGPVTLTLGGLIGGLVGLVFDLARAGISVDFLKEASNTLEPGKAALLAEINETSTVSVDTKLAKLGGRVCRQSRSEFVDEQLLDELNTINID